MQEEDKKIFVDTIQKNLVRSCFQSCRKAPNPCFDQCYEKYIATVNVVSRTIKDVGYQKHSLIAYKGYPEHNVESLLNLSRYLFDIFNEAPFAIQHEDRA